MKRRLFMKDFFTLRWSISQELYLKVARPFLFGRAVWLNAAMWGVGIQRCHPLRKVGVFGRPPD